MRNRSLKSCEIFITLDTLIMVDMLTHSSHGAPLKSPDKPPAPALLSSRGARFGPRPSASWRGQRGPGHGYVALGVTSRRLHHQPDMQSLQFLDHRPELLSRHRFDDKGEYPQPAPLFDMCFR